jgi:hypothetical protein
MSRFPLSRFLRRLGKFAEEGREFDGAGPEDGSFPPIILSGVAAVGRRAPALRRGLIPGPSSRKNAVEVGYAWVRNSRNGKE